LPIQKGEGAGETEKVSDSPLQSWGGVGSDAELRRLRNLQQRREEREGAKSSTKTPRGRGFEEPCGNIEGSIHARKFG